jgi:hypothetical protein
VSGAHTQTKAELEAQKVKRHRRYAASVGKQFCQLWRKGRMCSEPSVRTVAGWGVCKRHSDLLDAIVRDAKAKKRPRLKRAA